MDLTVGRITCVCTQHGINDHHQLHHPWSKHFTPSNSITDVAPHGNAAVLADSSPHTRPRHKLHQLEVVNDVLATSVVPARFIKTR